MKRRSPPKDTRSTSDRIGGVIRLIPNHKALPGPAGEGFLLGREKRGAAPLHGLGNRHLETPEHFRLMPRHVNAPPVRNGRCREPRWSRCWASRNDHGVTLMLSNCEAFNRVLLPLETARPM